MSDRQQDIVTILFRHGLTDKLQLFLDCPLNLQEIEDLLKSSQSHIEQSLYRYMNKLSSQDEAQQDYKNWLIAYDNAVMETSWKAAHSVRMNVYKTLSKDK